MTHLQFRISVINSLVKRRLIADQTSGSDPRDRVGPAATRGRGSSVAPSGRGSPVATRGPGRPVTVSRPTIPNRATTKRKVDMVTVVCGTNREDRKRVRAVPRLVPKLKLHAGRGKKYDIYGDKAMQRFQGGQCIPGLHPLKSIPVTCSFKCQVCRALGEQGKYGPKKNLKQPPRAKFTCVSNLCGGISLCGAECYNAWHIHPDSLSE